jgi:hypothetical protein
MEFDRSFESGMMFVRVDNLDFLWIFSTQLQPGVFCPYLPPLP